MDERIAEWQEAMTLLVEKSMPVLLNDAQDIIKALCAEIEWLKGAGRTGKLQIPYLSQWGAGADERTGDCGPAALAMAIHYLTTHRPTVDEVADACGQPESGEGSHYTNSAQIIKGAAAFGVSLELHGPYTELAGKPKMTTGLMIEYLMRDGYPSIPLIDYKVLRDQTNALDGVVQNQDQRFDRGHWVTFVGFKDADGVWVNDPNYWGNRASDGANRWVPWAAWNAALASAAIGNNYGYQGLVVTGVNR